MSADLHIHVLDNGCTAENVINSKRCTMGSKHFDLFRCSALQRAGVDLYGAIMDTSQIFVGEVSWLKAAVFDDPDYIPNTVGKIADVIGDDLPIIDAALIEKIRQAFTLENNTDYQLGDAGKVIAFLEQHAGKQVFTVSW